MLSLETLVEKISLLPLLSSRKIIGSLIVSDPSSIFSRELLHHLWLLAVTRIRLEGLEVSNLA
jgi:hypothetical protein